MIQNSEGCCKNNVWIQCENKQCENCGWNPDVETERKKKIYAKNVTRHGKTRLKRVYGLNVRVDDLNYTPTIITVQITTDDKGSSLSLKDDSKDFMLMIPLETVSDMLKIVEGKNA